MGNENLISDLEDLINNVSKIRTELYIKRKENKENFNFFTAIVSGKYQKHHLEKYHSNFISYLLDPKGAHDFGALFFEYFLKIIGRKLSIVDLENFYLEREKPIDNGRLIDISLEYENDYIIFIENKIYSEELEGQVKDYYDYAKIKFKNVIGIYLTLNGDKPNSIEDEKIICLSYNKIIEWVESCIDDSEVKKYPHIVSALQQYISILKNLLKNMKEETKQTIYYLKQNKEASIKIVENISIIKDSIYELVKEVRNAFVVEINKELQTIRENEKNRIPQNITIEIFQGDYIHTGSNNSYGLGFQVKYNNDYFKYGGEGFRGWGNGIYLNELNAHEYIDKSNSILLESYQTENWLKIVKEAANEIISEIIIKVIPKLDKQ